MRPAHGSAGIEAFRPYGRPVGVLTDAGWRVPPLADGDGGGMDRLRRSVSRFSTGEEHAHRRAAIEDLLAQIDPDALRAASRQLARADPTPPVVPRVPLTALAQALGVDDPAAVAALVPPVAAAYIPGAGAGAAAAGAGAGAAAAGAGAGGAAAGAGAGAAAAGAGAGGAAAGAGAGAAAAGAGAGGAAAGAGAGAAAAGAGAGAAAAGAGAGGAAAGAGAGAAAAGAGAGTVAAGAGAGAAAAGAGAGGGTADAAADELLARLGAARAAVLVQSCLPVTAWVRVALDRGISLDEVLATAPPVPATSRWRDGETVTVPLDGIPFGAGPRRCPGQAHARALADGVLDALRPA